MKLKLVDQTMGAQYTDREIRFEHSDILWEQRITNRSALSGKVYGDVIEIQLRGSEIIFRFLASDYDKAIKAL